MNDNQQHETVETTALVDANPAEVRSLSPSEQILAPLELSDYSQFLYDTNYGGKPGKDFTAEGVKTIGLQNGISTGEVKIEFLNEEKTEALFYCTATDRNGDTSERVVKQCEKENGRINPHWIEKGIARAERNAIRARLPIQLFKTALTKAIAAGEAEQSEIITAQKALGTAWNQRAESLTSVDKRDFYTAAQMEYGESSEWNVHTWKQVATDLEDMMGWVVALIPDTRTTAHDPV